MQLGRCCKCENSSDPGTGTVCAQCVTGPAPIQFTCSLTLPKSAYHPTANPIEPCCSVYTSPTVLTSYGLNCNYVSDDLASILGRSGIGLTDIICCPSSSPKATGRISGTLGSNIITITVTYVWYKILIKKPAIADVRKYTWSFGSTFPLRVFNSTTNTTDDVDYCSSARRLPFVNQRIEEVQPQGYDCGTGDSFGSVQTTPCGVLGALNSSSASARFTLYFHKTSSR